MVNIASLDRVSVGTKDVKSVSQKKNDKTNDFSSTLNKATQDTQKSKEATPHSSTVSNTTSSKVEDIQIKEESKDENQSSISLTLEFLLPTQNMEENEKDLESMDFSALFQATSIQQITELMGGQPLVEGEQLNLDQIAKALGMQTQDLQALIAKLTNTNQQVAATSDTNLWNELSKVDQKLMTALQQIAAAINGQGDAKLTKKEAQQAIALFKLVDLSAPKTDLTLKQASQAAQMKNWLTTLASQISEKTTEKEVTLPFAKSAIRFQTPKLVETPTNQMVATTTTLQNAKPSVVTIQLPTNGSSQSQAIKFAEEFQNVLNRAQFASNAAGTRLLIKLYPEHLGTIRIELVQKDGVLSARLLASNTAGKQMIDSTLHQLKQGFANQNIQIDRLDVAQALTEPNKNERGNQFGQQSSNSQQAEQEEADQKKEEVKSFDEILAEMEE